MASVSAPRRQLLLLLLVLVVGAAAPHVQGFQSRSRDSRKTRTIISGSGSGSGWEGANGEASPFERAAHVSAQAASAPFLNAFPKVVDAAGNGDYVGDFATVAWGGLTSKHLESGKGDAICYQNRHDEKVCFTSKQGVWIGMFTHTEDGDGVGGALSAENLKKRFRPVNEHDYPRSEPFIDPAPLKWKPVYANMTEGEMHMNVINWRTDLDVVLFYNGTTYPIPLAADVIRVEGTERPSQGHIALTDDPTEMQVSWNAKSRDPSARVRYGTASGSYTEVAIANAHTYEKSQLCGGPANADGWIEPGWFYDAVVANLTVPGQRIYYVYGGDQMGWSGERSFLTPPPIGPDESLKIVALADMGSTFPDASLYHWLEPTSNQVQAAATVAEPASTRRATPKHLALLSRVGGDHGDADLALMIGDLSYATGYAGLWDNYMHMIEPLASRIPYMTGHGNHEKDFTGSESYYQTLDSGGECGLPTTQRFRMPLPGGDPDAYVSWYSFEQGPVHFTMMDTEVEMHEESDQYEFLERDLASVDRARTPWVVFMGHRPMYSIWGRDSDIGAVEDLLMKNKVDLVLWGHGTSSIIEYLLRR